MRKERLLATLFVALVLFCAGFTFTACGGASSGGVTNKTSSEGLRYALTEDAKSYAVVGIGSCKDKDVVIPVTYNNLPVTSVGESAFRDCSNLTSVTIGNSVTSIERDAFRTCSSLTSVTFKNPNGWNATSWFKSDISLSSTHLSDPATAAYYLTYTYSNYDWKRS